jgi:hypothetical protein
MTIQRHYPASDCIASLAYDNERELCWVTFRRDGQTVELSDFPEIELHRWLSSGSVGQYWNYAVKGRY